MKSLQSNLNKVMLIAFLLTTFFYSSATAVPIGNFDITFMSVSYNYSLNRTTLTYKVTGTNVGHDLSNWVLTLCPTHQVVSASPNPWSVGTDPHSLIYGIKWDVSVLKNSNKTFTVTLNGIYGLDSVAIGMKASTNKYLATITGPSCDPPAPQVGSIGDRVWNDVNKNGIQDAGEGGIANVIVNLFDCNDNLIASTTTNANGNYLFSNLQANSYYVKFELKNGYSFSPKNAGNFLVDSDADPLTGKTPCFVLNAGQNDLSRDAGMYLAADKPVRPILECVINNGNGTYTAHFGYLNENSIPVVIPIGVDNKFTPGPDGKGQPTNFLPGRTDYFPNAAFTVVFDGSNLVWTLKGPDGVTRTATANASSAPCAEHVYFQKQWIDHNNNVSLTPPANLPSNYSFVATSIYGTATGTYDGNGNFVVVYNNNPPAADNNGLWVPVNGEYTVTENNLPAGWSQFAGFGTFTATIPGGFATNPYNGIMKYGLHIGKNKLTTPPSGDADLRILKTVDNNLPNDGDNVTFTVVVTNDGPSTATNVKVTDILPMGLDFVSSSATQGSYNANTGIWNVGTIPNGGTATLTMVATASLNVLNTSTFDLGPATGWNLFVLENLTQPSSDTEGKVAVGGNAHLANYSIGDQLPNSNGTEDVFVVGGDLTFISGAILGGNVAYGVSTNLPINQVSIVNGTLRQDYPINFAAAASYFSNLTVQLSNYAANATTQFEWGTLTFAGTDPFLNVFHVSGADLTAAHTVNINVPNGAVVLLNIDGNNISWTGGLNVSGTAINNVLYNFYEATNITIQGIDVRGSILAPFAHVNFVTGVQNGQMIAKSVEGMGQFNNALFQGNIPGDRTVVNIAEITAVDQNDPDSTPNNGNPNEDDYSSVTLTIKSTNGGGGGEPGGNWVYVGSFLPGELVSYITSDEFGNILVGTFWGKIYRSTDDGATWQHINPDMNSGYIWSIAATNGSIYVATSAGVYKTTNNGGTWTATGLFDKDVRSIAYDDQGNLFAGVWGYGMYKSTDNGATWTVINTGLHCLNIGALTVGANGDLYVGSYGNGVFKSTDGGDSWFNVNMGYAWTWSLAASSNGNVYAGTYGGGVFVSTDNGASWSQFNAGLNNLFIYNITVDAGNNVYVNAWAGGIYILPAGSTSWNSMGMNGQGVSSVFINPSSTAVYAGTAEGKMYMNNGSISSTKDEVFESVPTEFSLSQNYPNPFNPSTMIEFTITQREVVTLNVYNILGQLVRTLVDTDLEAGKHQVRFDANGLASGVYIYRLSTPSVSITKKMLLQK